MASTDAKPVPQKNVAYRVTFPIMDADGDLVTGATGLDSEISKNAGTFADVTAEATEIATASGVYYLDLTATEMNADTVAIIVKTTSSGAKTTTIVMYPEEAGDIRVNATQWNSLTTVALPLVPTTAGRTLDVSTTGEAGVDWANVGSPTTANALTGTTIATTQKVDVETIKTNPVVNAGTITFPTTATLASTTNITAGTIATATNVTTVNGLAAGVITAASIAADAITDAKVASDVTIASVTGAVNSVTSGVTVTTNNDKTGYALSATGSAALTEGYAADNAAPTLNQILYMIWSMLAEKSVTSTTLTSKKIDGTTSAMTFTLDSAVTPTSITRAT